MLSGLGDLMKQRALSLIPVLILGLGCGAAPTGGAHDTGTGLVRPGTPASVDIAQARARNTVRLFSWEEHRPAAFERARREKKPILLMGAAEWCHWCHVMDETTYRDPRVGKMLADGFVVIRVDIDERPDIGERYGDWGWPATILLSPEGEEIGKYKGYIPPEDLLPILSTVLAHPQATTESVNASDPSSVPAAVEALPWIAGHTMLKLDEFYDKNEGSWGFRQKLPMGENVLVELRRAVRGNGSALTRAVFTLEKQRALLDPVWGGIYQYSTGSKWTEPHYEKLMPYQTANLEAYSRAYAQTGRKDFLENARSIAKYLMTFLSSPEGGFYTNQDADVGSHERHERFVDGDVYYRLNDAERRKLGMPHIDEHVYAYENGLAIAALCVLYEVSGDADVLARALRATEFVLKNHLDVNGLYKHDAKNPSQVRHLPDSASMGLAMVRLYAATKDTKWLERSEQLAAAMEARFLDSATGALFAHTEDKSAVGVFAQRQRPFGGNVLAARFYAGWGGEYRGRALRILAAISTPRALSAQGRMIGEYLLALDGVGMVKWGT